MFIHALTPSELGDTAANVMYSGDPQREISRFTAPSRWGIIPILVEKIDLVTSKLFKTFSNLHQSIRNWILRTPSIEKHSPTPFELRDITFWIFRISTQFRTFFYFITCYQRRTPLRNHRFDFLAEFSKCDISVLRRSWGMLLNTRGM